MPPHSTPTGLFPLAKERKTPGGSCHVGTPNQSLRRVVKPLGEHNRSRSHSPALDSLSLKDKRTPRAQKTMLTGVDLSRRFADSIHLPCSLATNRTVDLRSPRGSPTLDRIQEGCSSSLGGDRKGATLKSRLRGGDDTPPFKKAITFSTPFGKDSKGKDSIRKEKLPKRKVLDEHFRLEAKKEDVAFSAAQLLTSKPRRDADFVSKESSITQMNQLEGQCKLMLSDLPMPKGIGFRGKVIGGDVVPLSEPALAARISMRDKMTMRMGHRSFGAKDAPCRLAFDAIELSPQGSKSLCIQSPGIREDGRLGAAATLSPGEDAYRKESNVANVEGCGADIMLSPLPSKSLQVMDGLSLNWGMQEDNVAHEWFHPRDITCFESYSKGSTTPEPQPSKSPELSRRAVAPGGVGALLESTGVEDVSNQQTPSPQPTNSPEFLKRGSVPPTGGCFGAGPLMGPEGMRSVKDRRKCKPRGILTIEGELLSSAGSADFDEEVQVKETISVPALASVEWMVAEGYEVEPRDHPGSIDTRDIDGLHMDASLKVSGSFSHLRKFVKRESSASRHRRCKSAVESASDQFFWKKGLLNEWNKLQVLESVQNLSLSDRKREETPSPSMERVTSVSHGKLRNFSPELTPPSRLGSVMGNSLVIGAFGSVTDTPPSYTYGENLHFQSDEKIEHRNDDDLDLVKGLVPAQLQELSLDEQAPPLSVSFSVESSPDSCESWQAAESTGRSNDSRGEWGNYLSSSRYKGFDGQFRFHATMEGYIPAAVKVESYNGSESREVSPSTQSVGYSDEGDSVVCTPGSTVTPNFSDCPQVHSCESPDRDSWKKYDCAVGKGAKGVGTLQGSGRISTVASFIRDASPDLVEISISISGAPSLDSSSDDFEAPRYHSYVREGSLMNQVHTALSEQEEETKVPPRGRVHLYEADYSPSSLLKTDVFDGVSVSASKSRGC